MAFCSQCGTLQIAEGPAVECPVCHWVSYRNPVPVLVTLAPVRCPTRLGVLAVRRAIQPHLGKLALPGGYQSLGETWQQAAVREVAEETGLIYPPDSVQVLHRPGWQPLCSPSDGVLLIFVTVPPIGLDEVGLHFFSAETSEVLVLSDPSQLVFPAHQEALQRFWDLPRT